jgi:hypothetical protein
MMHDTPRRRSAPEPESRTASRRPGSVRRTLAKVIPTILIVAAPLGMTVASVHGSSGAVGTSGDGGGTSSADKYERIWSSFGPRTKRWARRTSECESGGNRKIHGGGGTFHGAFQFMKSTWRSAPKSPGGDPHRFPWKTQAVVAVKLKKRDGAGHWPNCG